MVSMTSLRCDSCSNPPRPYRPHWQIHITPLTAREPGHPYLLCTRCLNAQMQRIHEEAHEAAREIGLKRERERDVLSV